MEPMKGEQLKQHEIKCRSKLQEIGFQLVRSSGLWATVDGSFIIDFSAVDPEKYLIYALKETARKAYADGQESVRRELRNLIQGDKE